MLRDLIPSSTALLVIALIVVMFLSISYQERRRLRRLREKHAKSHRFMSDEEFIRIVDVSPAAAPGAVAVRRAIAIEMGVPSLTLHPSDEWEYLSEFGADGMDFVDIVICIEDALGISIPDAAAEELASIRPLDVAGIIRWLVASGYLALQKTLPPVNQE